MAEQKYKVPIEKKKKIIWISAAGIIVLFIAIAGFFAINQKLSQKKFTEKMRLAEKYLSTKDYENAIIAYKEALEVNPKEEKSYIRLATVYMELSDVNKAKYYLTLGIKRADSCGSLQLMLNKVLDGRWKPKTLQDTTKPKEETEEEEEEEEDGKIKVSGVVVDAVTGEGVGGVKVTATPEDRKKDDGGSTKSKPNGSYEMELSKGEYVISIQMDGFQEEEFELEVKDKAVKNNNYTISPELSEGEIRIVLEWGAEPRDLDAHLLTPTGASVSFSNRMVARGDKEIANLDVDDTSGFGPETITIVDPSGEFEYWVDDFTNSNQIGSSGAKVKVYLPGKTPIVYEVPAGAGVTWNVFKLKDGEIIEVNTISEMKRH